MICPKCKIGELVLYKEYDLVHQYEITKGGKIYKRPWSTQKHDTEKNYLECKNTECNQYFDYALDDDGKIIRESLQEHRYAFRPLSVTRRV